MRCAACGLENPGGADVCERCGTALRGRSQSEERKLVTVLFADVEASTDLSRVLGAEAAREQLERFYGLAREEIEAHAGTVEKFIGDAVLAVFGLPAIHEDDPARAVRAALAIQTRVRLEADAGRLPRIRIGIATGQVVADPRAIDKGDFLVTGDSVNLAARLQQHGQPGQILVGESTYEATRRVFLYRPGPLLQIKGFPDRVATYECLEQRPLPRHAGLESFGSPLVGRDAEIAAFLGRIDRLEAGQGGIVTVIGDPGIGKSRLVAEGRRRVAERNVLWLEGYPVVTHHASSYWPFLEILKRSADIMERDTETVTWAKMRKRVAALSPAEEAEIVPYLGTMLGLQVPPEWQERIRYLSGEAMGRQVYRATRLFFERLARERPTVLVFEDLHWVDESSAALLEHLLSLVERVPIVFCVLGRPDPGTPAARLRAIAAAEYPARYTEIILKPLSQAEGLQLSQHLLKIDEVPSRVRETILRRAEGNPFFVEEIIRALIEMKAIVPQSAAGEWRVAHPEGRVTIPDTLRGVIMARVDRLDEEAKQLLKTASVIGRSFPYRVLRMVVDGNERLDQTLAGLRELELVHERHRHPELEFSFKHALTHEAIYESILVRHRRELHERVGNAIEVLFATHLEEFFGVLAYHYARAEKWDKAQEYLFKAGDQAGKIAADAEALAYYQQAMAAYERIFGGHWDPLRRAAIERKIGEALSRRGEKDLAAEHLQQALRLLGASFPTTRWGVRAAILREIVRQVGHRLLPRVLMAPRLSDAVVKERSRVYEAMGGIDYYSDLGRLMLEGLMGLNDCEDGRFTVGIARGSAALGLICDLIPFFRFALPYHQRAVMLAEQVQHPMVLGFAYLGLGFHYRHAEGKCSEALGCYLRAAAAYREAGELWQWGASTTLAAWVSRLMGEFVKSRQYSRAVLDMGQETSDPQASGWGLTEMGRTLLQTGQVREAVEHLEKAVELFRGIPDVRWVVVAGSALGQGYLRQGRLQDALERFEEVTRLVATRRLRGFHRTHARIGVADVYIASAEHALPAARPEALRRARQACRGALQQSRIDAEVTAVAYRLQGVVEWLSGNHRMASEWWQRSARAAERMGAPYELGLTLLEIGRRTASQSHLTRAQTLFSEMGIVADVL
jgi:class 3 adenylate cyclase/tetratricopeptide (TPR) repeat protein